MKTAFVSFLFLVACSVPDKQPVAPDAPIDAYSPDAEIDDTNPETTITNAPGEFSNLKNATFEFASDDPAATFTCSIDGDSQVPCTSPYIRSLADGNHGFAVRATDAAGNSDPTPAEHVWMIDTIAPNTTLSMAPPPVDNSISVEMFFESDEDEVTFECSLDNSAFETCTSGQHFAVGDGQHTFVVRARDRSGNVDPSPAVHAWLVDTSTPDTQILSGPTGSISQTAASFTFVSPDAGGGATFQCKIDNSSFVACTSPSNYVNLSNGEHTFAVRVRDSAGNFDPTPAMRSWIVDLSDPETTILSGPTGTMTSTFASFTFDSDEDGSFQCSLDTGTFTSCSSPASYTMLGQGMHTFRVRARDEAGHFDPTPAMRSWTVDTTPPDITFTAGPAQGATVGPRVTFAFTVDEGAPQCSLDAAPFVACTSPEAFSVREGAHMFRVRATDSVGNVSTATRSWTTACTAPTATGAVGLLHLDTADQVQANATGGAGATLGDDATVEPADPKGGTGRFGGALDFKGGDHVSWPLAAGATNNVALVMYVRPETVNSTVFATTDGRLELRTTSSGGTVRFTIDIDNRAVVSGPVTANVWHHVAITLSGAMLYVWVDGARVELPMSAVATPLALDAIQIGGTYKGLLDEIWLGTGAFMSDDAALATYCPM